MASDYAQEVSQSLIDQLERGVAPWQKPWAAGERFRPFNPISGNDYRGINSVYLMSRGFSDPRWLTYKQAQAQGAQVRRGQKGTRIEYWKFHGTEPVLDDAGNPIKNADGSDRLQKVEYTRPRVFHAVVFNAQQIDGMPPRELRPLGPELERHAAAEAILRSSGARITHGGDRAFYSLSTDSITLPPREQFQDAGGYYSTALHELGHWTGHAERLDRDLRHPFGSEGYAREELRAEIASLMMGDTLGIGHNPDRHAAYVGSWIKALKEDPREIFRAAADAEKIQTYVLGLQQERIRFLTEERAEDLSTLLHLRAEALQASRDAEAMMDMVRNDPGMDAAGIAEQQALASTWRDTAQANLSNAVSGAPEEVRQQWDMLMAAEGDASQAYSDFQDRAFDVEVAAEEDRGPLRAAASSAQQEWRDGIARLAIVRAELGIAVDQVHAVSHEDRVRADQRARFALDSHSSALAIGQAPKDALKTIDFMAEEKGLRPMVRFAGLSDWAGSDPNQPTYTVDYIDADGRLQPSSLVLDRRGRAAIVESGAVQSPPPISWEREQPQPLAIDSPDISEAQAVQANDARIAQLVEEAVSAGVAQQEIPIKEPAIVETVVPPAAAIKPDRVYLAIPFADKDEAKQMALAAGFRIEWDKEARTWSAPSDADLSQFGRWMPSGQAAQVVSQSTDRLTDVDYQREFTDVLQRQGFVMHDLAVMDGRIHRVPIEGDRGSEKSGAYKGYLDGTPAGYYENHRTGVKETWRTEKVVQAVSPEERARLNAEAAARRAEREVAQERQYDQAAEIAHAMFATAAPATADDPYCLSKGIDNPVGLRVVPPPSTANSQFLIAQSPLEMKNFKQEHEGRPAFMVGDLLVPARDMDGKVWTVQRVNPRFKGFMTGGKMAGLHTVAGSDLPLMEGPLAKDASLPLIVAEGYATADTISKVAEQPVIVAFNAGNLQSVVSQLRERFPDRQIIVAGDNDHAKENTIGPDGKPQKNVGKEKAIAAAESVNGLVMLPRFSKGEAGSDWNDKLMAAGASLPQLQREWRAQLGAARIASTATQAKTLPQASTVTQAQQSKPSIGNDLQGPRWTVKDVTGKTVLETDSPKAAMNAFDYTNGGAIVDRTTGAQSALFVDEPNLKGWKYSDALSEAASAERDLERTMEKVRNAGEPRWVVRQWVPNEQPPRQEVLLETDSATEALKAFDYRVGRSVDDRSSGLLVPVTFVIDKPIKTWKVAPELTQAAAAEKALAASLDRARGSEGADRSTGKSAQGQSQSQAEEKVTRKRSTGR
ncbi:zincin-like metallopeptidase domain-containing protein [Stenotrophomonas sp. GD03993]|uniref:zincin-like metallopeptidase domain-containing protein n=1 Tax=unclassified Stenotrophomonas TaxID=196198 RepID=UPI002448040D|nr:MULTISPECIES: zincin-like metallopeptidase domain-containing protein [unclassified Stenotrophomonas]MDH0187698.1 zincin-like metallopeptidase domain-containing protein [Stenotrophomonas sp. GD04051]MDH0465278.1 zincin-like metallopeptidase domain-containing protein [Stenotrophomonas sp. GD03993]MDH0877877.1 zincin-like metallopeptidase domain-containing protein [Stenotrophomonas sp. GD03877]